MRIMILALILFLLSGCTKTTPVVTEAPKVTATSRSGVGTLFAIQEVGLGPDGYVSLNNFAGQPANLEGLYLCQGAKCFELPNTEVAPSATVRVAVGNGAGLEGVVATDATIGELQPSGGEIALYASKKLSDPKAMLGYLEWGSTPHENTQVAIDAGLWVKGAFAPSSVNATRIYRNEAGQWLVEAK